MPLAPWEEMPHTSSQNLARKDRHSWRREYHFSTRHTAHITTASSRQEDTELTQVGPGTPCGEYLRRFWQPIITSAEVQDLPRRLRILGEDLVAFRDKSGAMGLLELYCPHRGTSLEYGLVCDKGLRCCYHGWLFDVDGKILETPGEPPDSTLKDRLYHGAYPVHRVSWTGVRLHGTTGQAA